MHSFEFIVRFVLGFIILLFVLKSTFVKKDYLVLLNQLDENLASDVSTRCSGRPQGNENQCRDSLIHRLYVRVWLLMINLGR